MSLQAVKWQRALRFEHPDVHSGMTQAAHNVLSYLTEKQNPKGECRASLKEIADAKGLSKKHVKRVLNLFVEIKVLSRWKKGEVDHWASEFEFGLGFVFAASPPHQLGTSCPELGTSCPGAGDILSEARDSLLIENQKQYQKQNRRNAPNFSQADFDERDRRKLQTELNTIYRALEGARIVETEHQREQEGAAHSHDGIFQRACDRAGIAVQRGRQLIAPAHAAAAPQAKRPVQRAVNE
jgi:hypothetical protein